MKAVDTNVLVRLLTRDDAAQAAAAADAMREAPIYLSGTVLLETEWVLRHAYGFDRALVGQALLGVVNLAGAIIDDDAAVRAALRWHAVGMDFADALHLAKSRRADVFVTFDKGLVRAAERLQAEPPVVLLGEPSR